MVLFHATFTREWLIILMPWSQKLTYSIKFAGEEEALMPSGYMSDRYEYSQEVGCCKCQLSPKPKLLLNCFVVSTVA